VRVIKEEKKKMPNNVSLIRRFEEAIFIVFVFISYQNRHLDRNLDLAAAAPPSPLINMTEDCLLAQNLLEKTLVVIGY